MSLSNEMKQVEYCFVVKTDRLDPELRVMKLNKKLKICSEIKSSVNGSIKISSVQISETLIYYHMSFFNVFPFTPDALSFISTLIILLFITLKGKPYATKYLGTR